MKLEDNNSTPLEATEDPPKYLTKISAAGDYNQSERTEEPEKLRKIFVGGLVASSTDETLREFYSQFGEITDVVVMRDSTTRRSRGFGFVTYTAKSMVDAAMAARPHIIDGKNVDAKRAVPRDEKNSNEFNISTSRLYVSGVRADHTEGMLKEYFSRFGRVNSAEIIRDKATGLPRGFAFITFDDYDAVDQCVLLKSHMINNHRCDVKKGLRKDETAQHQRDRNDRFGRSRGVQRANYYPQDGSNNGWGRPLYGDGYNDAGYNYNGAGYNQAGFGGGSYHGGYGEPQTPTAGAWLGQQSGGEWPSQGGGWGQGVQPQQQQAWGHQQPTGLRNSSGAQQWSSAHGAKPEDNYYY